MKTRKVDDRLRVYLTLPNDMLPVMENIKKVTGLEITDFVKLVFTMYYSLVFNSLVKTRDAESLTKN